LEFYYLGSRYYDAEAGRFISPDSVEYLGANGDLISYNLYAYCSNNPVMGYDPMGTWDRKAWNKLGENFLKAAVILTGVAGAVLIMGASIGGTIATGGAGAVALPAAAIAASQVLVAAAAVVTVIGVASISVSYLIGENGTQTPSETTWVGKGKERLDVENPAPGARDGQIHYHDPQNGKYMYNFFTGQFDNPTKRLKKLFSDKGFLNGLKKALKYLGE